MKRVILVLFLLVCYFYSLNSQIPQGFNYQAIARDGATGNPITDPFNVKIAILSSDAPETVIYEELFELVAPDNHGLFSIEVGQGICQTAPTYFTDIDWSVTPKYIRTQIYYEGEWKNLGSAQLWSVPYSLLSHDTYTKQTLSIDDLDLSISGGNTVALPVGDNVWQTDGTNIFRTSGNVGIGTDSPALTLDVIGDAIFRNTIQPEWIEVTKNTSGDRNSGIDFHGDDTYTDFSLRMMRYNNGFNAPSRIWHRGTGAFQLFTEEEAPIDFYTSGLNRFRISATGNIGIGNLNPTGKMVIQPSETWEDNLPLFEVKNKAGIPVFAVYNNGIKIIIDDTDEPLKGPKGGFAIGGYDYTKAGSTVDFMRITPDSIRFNINNEPDTKGPKGGFAIGGYGYTKGEINQDFMYITPQLSNAGLYNTFVGYKAGELSSSGSNYNSFFGYNSGQNNQDGDYNTFFGYECGKMNVYGTNNVFMGLQAGYNNGIENSVIAGCDNVFIGSQAGYTNVFGFYNVFIGYKAGYSSGNSGTPGLANRDNVFIGTESGYSNTSGKSNTFIGSKAGHNSDATGNVFIGASAGRDNSTGTNNVFIGQSNSASFTNGIQNVCIGSLALTGSGGNYNVIIGSGCESVGSGNVFIGCGAGKYEDGSNKLYIDNSGTSLPLIYGDFTNGSEVVRINGNLEYTGDLTDVSDSRLKKDLLIIDNAVQKLNNINGYYFNWNDVAKENLVLNDNRQIGIIAQEVEKVFPELVSENGEGYKTMDYVKLTPILLQAIKEQQSQIETMEQRIIHLEQMIIEVKTLNK